MVGREENDIQKVIQWLNSYEETKLVSIHPHRDWITVSTTVRNVEKLFLCSLGFISDEETGYRKIAAVDRKYTIPEAVGDVIEVSMPHEC